ncbi:MAG: hypothetical protein WC356_05475 [Candidatus Micrarchaeia archaeon]|jgi:hypothetical protein
MENMTKQVKVDRHLTSWFAKLYVIGFIFLLIFLFLHSEAYDWREIVLAPGIILIVVYLIYAGTYLPINLADVISDSKLVEIKVSKAKNKFFLTFKKRIIWEFWFGFYDCVKLEFTNINNMKSIFYIPLPYKSNFLFDGERLSKHQKIDYVEFEKLINHYKKEGISVENRLEKGDFKETNKTLTR